jgi:hypothetical protein
MRTITSTGSPSAARVDGNEAEVERKHHPFGQQPTQHEKAGIRIIIELISPAFGRFYDRPANACLGVELVGKRL